MRLRFVCLSLIAGVAWACGAVSAESAAKPRAPGGKKPPHPPAAPARPRAPQPISGANAESVKLVWEAAAGGKGRAVAVSRSLARVAVATGGSVELYDLVRGKSVKQLATCKEVLRGGLVFDAGKLLVVCERSLELWDAKKVSKLEAPTIAEAPITAVDVRWPLVALGHDDGVLRFVRLDGGAAREIAVPGPPIDVKSLALSADGKRVAVGWVQGSIWWWDIDAPSTPHDLVRHPSECDALTFSDDGAWLAEEGKPNQTTLWSFAALPPKAGAEVRNGAWLKRLLFTRDARWLVRGGSDGLELAEIAGPRRVALDTSGQVEDAAFDEATTSVAAVDRAGRLTYWAAR